LSIPSAQKTHITELVNNIAKFGHEIHLIALKKGDAKLERNIFFHRLPPIIPSKRLISFCTYQLQKIYANSMLPKLIKKFEIDVIYERYGRNYALLASNKLGIPSVLEINGIPSIEAKIYGATEKEIKKIQRLEIERAKLASKIVCVSDSIKNYYVSIGFDQSNFYVVPNGVNLRLFKSMDRTRVVQELGLNIEDYNVIAFVGTLWRWQDLGLLIRSAPFIIREYPKTKFLIVGGGSFFEHWKKTVDEAGLKDNFIFTGNVPYEAVPKYINASTICVAPLIKRGCSPLKIYEYMACERPIVATKIKDLEFIEKQNAGFLVEEGDVKDFSNRIIALWEDASLRKSMGKNGRNYVVSNHSWEIVAKKVVTICNSLVPSTN
jgi:glycosyltransferase involved in cell wall biosynthesis